MFYTEGFLKFFPGIEPGKNLPGKVTCWLSIARRLILKTIKLLIINKLLQIQFRLQHRRIASLLSGSAFRLQSTRDAILCPF
jgi:hypothetical protein